MKLDNSWERIYPSPSNMTKEERLALEFMKREGFYHHHTETSTLALVGMGLFLFLVGLLMGVYL